MSTTHTTLPTTPSTDFLFAGGSGLLIAAAFLLSYSKRKNQQRSSVVITLPSWLCTYFDERKDKEFKTDEEMIMTAVDISSKNVSEKSGGPFGCAIFERDIDNGTTKLFSVGANRVVPLSNCTCHAEMVAIQLAQMKLGHFSMRQQPVSNQTNGDSITSDGTPRKEFILCTSCEPCVMCLGATLWSGVSELLCSATKDDAEAIGFNEGPVFEESYTHLKESGIKVKRRILREKGKEVLDRYGKTGVIYNA